MFYDRFDDVTTIIITSLYLNDDSLRIGNCTIEYNFIAFNTLFLFRIICKTRLRPTLRHLTKCIGLYVSNLIRSVITGKH